MRFAARLLLLPLTLLTWISTGFGSEAEVRLWYRQPAAAWHEALPVGNGRLGAMVYGGAAQERLQLNEATVWSGRPGVYDRSGAHAHFPEIRRLLFEGRHGEAEERVNREVLGDRPLGSYQPLGDLRLTLPGHETFTDYRRELDLDRAIVRITYRVGDTTFTREVFSSAPHQVLVIRLTADRPHSLTLEATLGRAEGADATSRSDGTVVLTGQADRGKPTAGSRFAAQMRVVAEGGTVEGKAGVCRIVKAESVTLLLAAGTDYAGRPEGDRLDRDLKAAAAAGFPALRDAHVNDHRRLFRRVSLQLGGEGEPTQLPTDDRLRRFQGGASDPGLLALYFQYGRYLLIGSSRPGSANLPANLQGIWNEDLNPPWFCGWHFDVNAQMIYWLAESTNLAECHTPLFDLIERLRTPGRATARDVYGTRGFVVSHRTNAWLFTSPVKGLTVWPTGAAWLCQHLWEHYRFSLDRTFLETRGYPVMKEAAEFLLDWLVPDPRTGLLLSGPSISPENSFTVPGDPKPRGLVMGPTMDQQIAAELFDNCLAAARVLGIDDAFTREVQAKRARLAPTRVGADGRLLEWQEPLAEREPGHRHMSHLYAVYPGWQITPRTTPELAEGARKSLAFRVSGGGSTRSVNLSDSSNTGWSLAWNAGLWARLGDAAMAQQTLTSLVGRAAFPNLMDFHPRKDTPGVFQIDGNLGGAAAIAEMLLQSHAEEIVLLPAVPPKWRDGAVTGLRARGAVAVDLVWRQGRLVSARLRPDRDGALTVRCALPFTVGKQRSRAEAHGGVVTWTAKAGQSYDVLPLP
ncbi:MAG: glycoside hydrolase family 95 protein [Opitutaceae bacterium]|nr:glycoside hydrolase family 95 protein [Opitutaceae bacterium]